MKSMSREDKRASKAVARSEKRQRKEAKRLEKRLRKQEARAAKQERRRAKRAGTAYPDPALSLPSVVLTEPAPGIPSPPLFAGDGNLSTRPVVDSFESPVGVSYESLDRGHSDDLAIDRDALSYSGDDVQFPDAISVTAEFGAFSGLMINGDTIDEVGILTSIQNTSWGDGLASAFERHPDDHFSDDHGRLSDAARRAIAGGQPYGIFELEVELPFEVLALLSAPDGFDIEFEREEGETEIEFEIDLDDGAIGLLFDGRAPNIPGIFEDPRTGLLQFFLSTESDVLDGFDEVYMALVEVEAEFAWAEGGEVVDRFEGGEFRHRELEVEKSVKIAVIPEPGTGLLTILGLVVLAARRYGVSSRA
jgi:hypothetical protein